MKGYKEYFKGKKITMLGLGLLGRGLGDAKFLAECGADLLVTDLKTKEQLAPTLKKLAKYKNIHYVLGEHRLEDFHNRDLVIRGNDVPPHSPYVLEAQKNNIPVEMEGSLFAKLTQNVTFVGITGTRGKTTTTYLIYEILKTAFPGKVYLGGNIRGMATLPLIKKIKSGDIMVMELDSWQLQGWGESKMSPHISVFTNFMNDHLNYYLKAAASEKEAIEKYFYDKAHIFRHQKKDNFLITDAKMKKEIFARHGKNIQSKIIIPNQKTIVGWKLKIKGEHNIQNILKAIDATLALGVSPKIIKKVVENFKGVEGRMEFLREYKRVKIYNDTTATTPDATVAALKALVEKPKNIILIMGGADKNLDMKELIKAVPKYCKKVVLLAGSGTEKLGGRIGGIHAESLKKAVFEALKGAKKGDIMLLSPAFASFGMFKNEYDRGDQFIKIIKGLK